MGLRGKGRELPISVQFSVPIHNGHEQKRATFTVRDETARIVLLEFELDPEQFLALLGNSTAYVTGVMPKKLDHVGKRHEHGSTVLGKKYDISVERASADANAWAFENGWETVELHTNNVGDWVATGRRWVDPE